MSKNRIYSTSPNVVSLSRMSRMERLLTGATTLIFGLSLLGDTPSQASTEKPFTKNIPTQPGERPAIVTNEFSNPNIPEAVASIMKRDTLSLNLEGGGCSGTAIRNSAGKVIGAVTAEHCLRFPPIRGSNGRYYRIHPTPDKAQTGDTPDNLKTVATLDSYLEPAINDTTHDLVLAIARGHSRAEVIKAYEQTALTTAEIHQLKIGEKVYLSGWPTYQPQPNSEIKTFRRQAFAMSVLGLGRDNVNDKIVDVVWAVVPLNKDGASCSWGLSGGEGFIMINGKPRSIGILSVFKDLGSSGITGPGATGGSVIKQPKANAVALCGFSYERSYLGNGGLLVHSVRSGSEIPGYHSPDVAMTKASKEFNDSNYSKTIIEGTTLINTATSDIGGLPQWVKNPIIFHDAKHNDTVIAWAGASRNPLIMKYLPDNALNTSITIYPNQGQTTPSFLSSSGLIRYESDPTGQTSGDFVDSNGQSFGAGLTNFPPTFNSPPYSLVAAKDGLHFVVQQR